MCSKNTLGILPICQPGKAGHRLGSPQGKQISLSSSSGLILGEINDQAYSSFLGLWLGLPFSTDIFLNALSSTVPTFSWRLMVLKAMPVPITPLPLCFPNPWIPIFARGKFQMHKQWFCCKYSYFLASSFPLILLGPQCQDFTWLFTAFGHFKDRTSLEIYLWFYLLLSFLWNKSGLRSE